MKCKCQDSGEIFELKKLHDEQSSPYCGIFRIKSISNKKKIEMFDKYKYSYPFDTNNNNNNNNNWDTESESEYDSDSDSNTNKNRYRSKQSLVKYRDINNHNRNNDNDDRIAYPNDKFGLDQIKNIEKTLSDEYKSNPNNDSVVIALNAIDQWQKYKRIDKVKYNQINSTYSEISKSSTNTRDIPILLDTSLEPEVKRRKINSKPTKPTNKPTNKPTQQKQTKKVTESISHNVCVCNKSFPNDVELEKHFKSMILTKDPIHLNTPFRCPFPSLCEYSNGPCGQYFPNEDKFMNHKLSQHALCFRKSKYIPNVQCPHCKGPVYAAIKRKEGRYVPRCPKCKREPRKIISYDRLLDNIRSKEELDELYPPFDINNVIINTNINNNNNNNNNDNDDDIHLDDIDAKMKTINVSNSNVTECPGCHVRVFRVDFKKHILICPCFK